MPDSEKPAGRAPVPVEKHALVAHERRTAVAVRTLGGIERRRAIEFFATHPQAREAFVAAASRSYPLGEAMIDRYADQLKFGACGLSDNPVIPWSESLLARYADRWNWGEFGEGLSSNQGLPWTPALLQHYIHKWDWPDGLSRNSSLPWSELLIEQHLEGWSWQALALNEGLPWNETLISCYIGRPGWIRLGGNRAVPWTEALIERFADRWLWRRNDYYGGCLTSNDMLPWSERLIDRYQDRWDWSELSGNPGLRWTEALIEKYADRWNWERLSENEGLPWSILLVERFESTWDWYCLSRNESLPWTEDFLDRYAERWVWDGRGLSLNPALPWSKSLIARYADQWNWDELSGNSGLPWTEVLLDIYAARWHWGQSGLSGNEGLPWSIALIVKYRDRWDWGSDLFRENLGRLLRNWTEQDICAVMDWSASALNEEAYAKAKRLFVKGVRQFQRADADIVEMVRTLVRSLVKDHGLEREAVENMQPYIKRFVGEVESGKIDLNKEYEDALAEGIADLDEEPTCSQADQEQVERTETTGAQQSVESTGQTGERSPNVDTEKQLLGLEVAVGHFERGVHKFADFARRVVSDTGDWTKPYLKQWYIAIMMDPSTMKATKDHMDTFESVEAADIDALLRVAEPVIVIDSGMDPWNPEIMTKTAAFLMEGGARSFAEFARTVAAHLGVPLKQVRPYLRGVYTAVREAMEDAGLDISGMDDADMVKVESRRLFDDAAVPTPLKELQTESASNAAEARVEKQPRNSRHAVQSADVEERETDELSTTTSGERSRSVEDQILDATVKDLIEMPQEGFFWGVRSGLETVWDEMCVEVHQVQQSLFWVDCIATIRAYLEGYLDERSTAEKHEIMPGADDDEIVEMLLNDLLTRAATESSEKALQFINRQHSETEHGESQPTGRAGALLDLTWRIKILLEQEENPQETMAYLEERLYEANVAHDLRTDDPGAFAMDLLGALETADAGLIHYPTEDLETFETAEELVLRILPTIEW